MPFVDPHQEWLGYVQPVGLVLSPAVLDRYNLPPEEQTRSDGEAVAACLTPNEEARALVDPWTFFHRVLGWREHQVAGLPGGAPLPEGVSAVIEEADTSLEPHWAVIDPEGRPTLLVRIEAPGVAPDKRGALAGWEATPHQRFERLLRENEACVRAGLLVTDDQIRLVYAPKGETSGWLSLPHPGVSHRRRPADAGRPQARPQRLPPAQRAARAPLAGPSETEPRRAGRGFCEACRAGAKRVAPTSARVPCGGRGAHYEARGGEARPSLWRPAHRAAQARLPALCRGSRAHSSATDEEARRLYDQGYGVRGLHAKLTSDAARYPDTMRSGAGLGIAPRPVPACPQGRRRWLHPRPRRRSVRPGRISLPDGQDAAGDPIKPATVSDACILGVLDKLLVLGGERLSYRTLDVEQIGSVYETVMGFTVETMAGQALALRGGKNDKVPVFVDLAELANLRAADRQKRLKEAYDVKLPDKVAKAVTAAKSLAEVEAALKPRVDERGSPGGTSAPAGSPLLQPTDERRRTGSHYTPRSLTEPIVRHALEPAFERLGADAKPDDVLALKVCDPAMGSAPSWLKPAAAGGAAGQGLGAVARDAADHPAGRGRGPACAPPRRPALPLRRRQEPASSGAGEALALAGHLGARARIHLPRSCAEMRRQPRGLTRNQIAANTLGYGEASNFRRQARHGSSARSRTRTRTHPRGGGKRRGDGASVTTEIRRRQARRRALDRRWGHRRVLPS